MTAIGFFGLVVFTCLLRVLLSDSMRMNKLDTVLITGFLVSLGLFTAGVSLWLWKVMP
jgi:hypothetical protein